MSSQVNPYIPKTDRKTTEVQRVSLEDLLKKEAGQDDPAKGAFPDRRQKPACVKKLDLWKIPRHESEDLLPPSSTSYKRTSSPNQLQLKRSISANSVGKVVKIASSPLPVSFSDFKVLDQPMNASSLKDAAGSLPLNLSSSPDKLESPKKRSSLAKIRKEKDSPRGKDEKIKRTPSLAESDLSRGSPARKEPASWNLFSIFPLSKNSKIKKKLKKAWRTNQVEPVSPSELKKLITVFARAETDKDFEKIPDPRVIPCGALEVHESPRSLQILNQFVSNWNVLKNLVDKFKEWEKILNEMRPSENTTITVKLKKYVGELIKAGEPLILSTGQNPHTTKMLKHFVAILEDFLWSKADKELSGFVLSIWKEEYAMKVRESLKIPSDLVPSVHHTRSWELISIANIIAGPGFLWQEVPGAQFAIAKITLGEVKRCLGQFKKGFFIFNDIEPELPEFNDDQEQQKKILARVLDLFYNPKAILAGLPKDVAEEYEKTGYNPDAYLIGREVGAEEIQAQVEYIFSEKAEDPNMSKILARDLQAGELLLKLATMSCWNRCDDIIKVRYKEPLFSTPYWSRPFDSPVCNIRVSGPGDFECTQIKCYGTHLRSNQKDDCMKTLQPNTLSFKTWFSWTVYPCAAEDSNDWYWCGEQAITNAEIMDFVTDDEIRKQYLAALKNPPQQIDLSPDAKPSSPHTPALRKPQSPRGNRSGLVEKIKNAPS